MIAINVPKVVVFSIGLSPIIFLFYFAFSDQLTANPIEFITHYTGDWALYFLLITLTISPIRKLKGWSKPLQFRRMLGLFAFFYASCHFCTYFVLDQFFNIEDIIMDIAKRPYITVGFSAFLLLLPLALTSTKNMMKRMGKRWKPLHTLVYPATTLVILHFLWLVKADLFQPLLFGTILIVLLSIRLINLKRT